MEKKSSNFKQSQTSKKTVFCFVFKLKIIEQVLLEK